METTLSATTSERLLRPTRAEVNLDAIRHNVRLVRGKVGAGTTIMAVVKSNAYGHGAIPVARAALEAGATALGVATSDEALELRETTGFTTIPILTMAPTLIGEAEALQEADVAVAVGSRELLEAHLEIARKRGRPAKLHIQIDTGMGRDGFRFDDLDWLNVVRDHETCIDGVWTHFAVADGTGTDHRAFTDLQMDRFEKVLAAVPFPVTSHAANSGAILRHPRAHRDMVRPGIMLYGIEPADDESLAPELMPALSLKSALSAIRLMEPGDSVSYGRQWSLPDRRRIGIVPIGYGDGYARHLSNEGDVLVGGKRIPIRGRICMDQLMVDLSGVPEAELGDEVVLIGSQGAERITAEEMARSIGTIGYEIVCRITARVPRVYTGK